ncbi:hypothetical protein [Kordia zhangzhouensis]|uniref:hypothetical protein n=1 Tax=Kordia zhangzhouensis TaxID=1620405 RepID=UPI0006299818|nr:hypothetical protein [Kordia zhangzhouensis]
MRIGPILIFRILLGIILLGKITNWFFKYNDTINYILNTAMFTLIGIWFVSAAYVWDSKRSKVVFLICGLYLIVINFVPDFYLKSIIGIPCIIIPLLIMRFSKHDDESEDDIELVDS